MKHVAAMCISRAFKVEDGILYHKHGQKDHWMRVVMTLEEQQRILNACHSSPQGDYV